MTSAPHAAVSGGVPLGADGATSINETSSRPSLGELFADVSRDLSTLVRQEVELAKAELTQSATRAGKGAGLLAGAGVAGHFVLLFLSVALWWTLGEATGHGWSALIVAGVWAIAAAVLAMAGRRNLQEIKGLPRTTGSVKQIPEALKGHEGTTR